MGGGRLRKLDEERHRAVVDQLDLHLRAEDAAGGVEAVGEALVERLGVLRSGRGHVGRAIALARVAVEGELADDEDLLAYPTVWAAAGTPSSVFPIEPGELVARTGGRVERVAPAGDA